MSISMTMLTPVAVYDNVLFSIRKPVGSNKRYDENNMYISSRYPKFLT